VSPQAAGRAADRAPDAARRWILANVPRFFDLVYALPGSGVTLYNYGYAPVSEAVLADPACAREPFQHELYRQAWLAADDPGAGGLVVDMCSGRGAGSQWLSRQTAARVLGLERSGVGRLYGRLAFGQHARRAVAPALPLPDASVDVMLCVEASRDFFGPAYAAEVARVLSPGGVYVDADCPKAPFATQRARVAGALKAAGMVIRHARDIAPQVVAACDADTPRRRRAIRWLPPAARAAVAVAFGCAGTEKCEALRSGARGYYLIAAQKPST
jgi:SAM-dependent methyltransferase